jgi:dihydrofolate reductase
MQGIQNSGLNIYQNTTPPNTDIDVDVDVRMIVAMDQNQLIGVDNNLPWHLPLDLKLFKIKTLYQHILMGYHTFESIIKRLGKPLPYRLHWVLTRKNIVDLPRYDNVRYISDIQFCILNLIDLAKQNLAHMIQESQSAEAANPQKKSYSEQLWVIGGSQIYELMKDCPWITEMHITHIHKSFKGDVHLNINPQDWQNWHKIEEKSLLEAYQSSVNYLQKSSKMPLFQELTKKNQSQCAEELLKQLKLKMDLTKNDLSEDELQTTVKIYRRIIK